MPRLEDAQAAAFQLANQFTPFNPDSAIAKAWLDLKKRGVFIGVPIGPEMPIEGDGTAQAAQAFTSGAVLVWRGGNDVDLI
jgi:hypothetical protein